MTYSEIVNHEIGPDVHRHALEIWRMRERGFPPRVQRMTPDAIDMATGAWTNVLAQAEAEMPGLPLPRSDSGRS